MKGEDMPTSLAPLGTRLPPASPTRRSVREAESSRRSTGRRDRTRASRPRFNPGRLLRRVAASVTALLLVATVALAPTAPLLGFAATPAAQSEVGRQTFAVGNDVQIAGSSRDGFTYTDGMQSLVEHGTNHDWAKLVLMYAGWPTTDSNVAVFTRWMRQENGPDDWWNRNNPLNNGYGSGGGSGLGSYDSLVTAAQMAAENLQTYSGYGAIRAGFASSAPEGQIESAIWASPWATSHYGNGSHWSHSPVPEVTAPSSAWG